MNLLYNTLKTFNRIFSKNNGENNIIKVDKNKLNPYYLKYQLDSEEFQKTDWLYNCAVQE